MSKGKILFLHGFVQSGPVFSSKTSSLRKQLQKKNYDTFYPTSPIKLTPADIPFDTSSFDSSTNEGKDYRAWWIRDETTQNYSLDAAIESLHEIIKEHGPFVGIVGFSQGAGLAGALFSQFNKIFPENQNKLIFTVFYSGFKLEVKDYDSWYGGESEVDSLHILGELDSVVDEERSMKLFNVCADQKRVLLKHPGGHFVPGSKDMVGKVVNWIDSIVDRDDIANDTPKLADTESKKENDEEDLDALMSSFAGGI